MVDDLLIGVLAIVAMIWLFASSMVNVIDSEKRRLARSNSPLFDGDRKSDTGMTAKHAA